MLVPFAQLAATAKQFAAELPAGIALATIHVHGSISGLVVISLSVDCWDAVAALDGARVSHWYAGRPDGHDQRDVTADVDGIRFVIYQSRPPVQARPPVVVA